MKTPYVWPSGTKMRDVPPDAIGIPYDEWMDAHNPPLVLPSEIIAIWERNTGESAMVLSRMGFIRNSRFGRGGEQVIAGTNRAKSREWRRIAGEGSAK